MSCPPSILLFGSGLVGLAMLGLLRRRKPRRRYRKLVGFVSDDMAMRLHRKWLRQRGLLP